MSSLKCLARGRPGNQQPAIDTCARTQHWWFFFPLISTGCNEESAIYGSFRAEIVRGKPIVHRNHFDGPPCCCRGRFDRLPHHLVPKNVLELARNLKAKASSRGCGPTLWKWILKQPWSHSHYFDNKWSYSVANCHWSPEYAHTDAWTVGIQGKSLPSPFVKPSFINLEHIPTADLNPLIQLLMWEHIASVRIPLNVETQLHLRTWWQYQQPS